MRREQTSLKVADKARGLLAAVILTAISAAAETKAAEPRRLILVSIPDRKLALLEEGRVVKVYPVAVGAQVSPSPAGEFKIVNRVVKPVYYHAGTVIEPGPKNPLGTRWMGLSVKGYGIHGTNAPRSIGKAASHGCVRMAKADLEDLFQLVRVGDVVIIRDSVDEQTAAAFGNVTQSPAATTMVLAQAQTDSAKVSGDRP